MNIAGLNEAYEERSRMEKRMCEIIDFLTSPGPDGKPPVGLHGNLLDDEGYPRSDIDIVNIRTLRHELAVMRTAYEALDQKLRNMTYSLFESVKESQNNSEEQSNAAAIEISMPKDNRSDVKQENSTSAEVGSEPVTIDPLMEEVLRMEREEKSVMDWLTPNDYFGSIRSTQPGSVADRAGIQDCDRVIRFGPIDSKSFTGLKQIAEYFEKSRGSVISITVGRYYKDHYKMRTIEMLVPKDTSERLGIHFVPKE